MKRDLLGSQASAFHRAANSIENVITVGLNDQLNSTSGYVTQELAHLRLPRRMQVNLWVFNEQ